MMTDVHTFCGVVSNRHKSRDLSAFTFQSLSLGINTIHFLSLQCSCLFANVNDIISEWAVSALSDQCALRHVDTEYRDLR